ncbi:alpha-1,2-fucosyltransferase [Sporolactobacillus kofuensis]|uniref:Alpha-1,2-fucosyltransferase n=1 Tax=Sporolactobacillus kofuensis TaxID=269672 RepID=A0ABW1WHL1_9BACL|nr:alpha-1,2-fucosyltransferase [Sporolactobacillus kofuensis]MCO7177099.1 alpha-1,2-fucosyltransferase [Sporolactobacillus kofuensis]
MIVVNVNSGLGNQMYHYAIYLELKRNNPNQECYIDNSIFEITGKTQKYALESVFSLSLPNIKNLVRADDYKAYIEEAKPIANQLPNNWLSKSAVMTRKIFLGMLSNYGIVHWNEITDLVSPNKRNIKQQVLLKIKATPIIADLFYKIKKQEKGYNLRLFYQSISSMYNVKNYKLADNNYLNYILTPKIQNTYYLGNFESGTTFFKNVEEQVRKDFVFPELDKVNSKLAQIIQNCESVSIHVRKGDHPATLVQGKDIMYFYKAVNFMKKVCMKPQFFVFSDDINWCRKNMEKLGLYNSDKVVFVDGNTGINSYKDMQLMSLCKHNIISRSTFSWWASYLNNNPNKVVCAPKGYWAESTLQV